MNTNQLEIQFPNMEYTFADFFCGCGGLSLGFLMAGLKCISAMDISTDALRIYWYNLCYKTWSHLWVDSKNEKAIKKIKKWEGNGKTGNWLFPNGVPDNWLKVPEPMPCLNLFCWSIMDLDPHKWMELCGVSPGEIRIFAGGPPCQGFSTANVNRNVYDERNRLPLRYLYYAKVARPDYIFMENVPGLLSLGKQKDENEGPFVRWIREAFHEAGYDMDYNVHNAADYGVPQNRKRVIFIGRRKGISKIRIEGGRYGEGLGKIPFQNVFEAIGDLPPLHAGETWTMDEKIISKGTKAACFPYGMNKKEGYVICPKCLKYNKEERLHCIHCGYFLEDCIKGGVIRLPGLGTLINTKKEVDNELLRKYFNGKWKINGILQK